VAFVSDELLQLFVRFAAAEISFAVCVQAKLVELWRINSVETVAGTLDRESIGIVFGVGRTESEEVQQETNNESHIG
jgi:hypothetical protein